MSRRRRRLSFGDVRTLDEAEVRAFLLAGTRTAKVAVVRRDGSPLVTPVWFMPDEDGSIVFETGRASVKGRALARDPRLSICVEDDEPPFGFVRIDGIAELSDDHDELLFWTTRIAARYMGEDQAEELGRRNAAPSELLVRVHPRRVVAQVDLAD
jgi:PPOX class probable F420-dependent enzyme